MSKVPNFLIIFLILFNMAYSKPTNVYGSGDKFVDVTIDESRGEVYFKLCLKKDKSVCERIGNQNYYRISRITNRRNTEKWQVAGALVADVGIILVGIGGGFVGGILAYATGALTTATYTTAGVIGSGVATTGGVLAINMVDALNPYEQYKQLETITDEVINDVDVFTETDSVTFAKRLAAVLDSLE